MTWRYIADPSFKLKALSDSLISPNSIRLFATEKDYAQRILSLSYPTRSFSIILLGLIKVLFIWHKEHASVFVTNFLKAFDFMKHKLLIAKWDDYGLNISYLLLIYSFLKERTKLTKMRSSHNWKVDFLYNVPHCLGPLV